MFPQSSFSLFSFSMVLIMSHALHRDDITKRRCTVDFKVECLDCIARIGVSDFF